MLRGDAVAAVLIGAAGAALAKAPAVTPVDAAGVKRALAARKGKVVVVNYWATWCSPCVAEFPRFVGLYNKYKDKGLELMMVSVDMARDVRPKVVPFLARNAVTAGAFVQAGSPEAFIRGIDPSWQGDVPRTYIYDRGGRLMKKLTGEQTAAALEAVVKPLLAKR